MNENRSPISAGFSAERVELFHALVFPVWRDTTSAARPGVFTMIMLSATTSARTERETIAQLTARNSAPIDSPILILNPVESTTIQAPAIETTILDMSESPEVVRIELARFTVNRSQALRVLRGLPKSSKLFPMITLKIGEMLTVELQDNEVIFAESIPLFHRMGFADIRANRKELIEILSSSKCQDVEFRFCAIDGKNCLEIETRESIRAISAETWEKSSSHFEDYFPAEFATCVNELELLGAIKKTEFATDNESSRYALGGIFLDCKPESLTIAATDSRRLSVQTIGAKTMGPFSARHAVLPQGISTALSGALKRARSGSLVSIAIARVLISDRPFFTGITIDSNSEKYTDDSGESRVRTLRTEIVIESDAQFSIRCAAVEGRFPRYLDVIPRNETRVTMEIPSLLAACQAVCSARDEENRGAEFWFYADGAGKITLENSERKALSKFQNSAIDSAFSFTVDPFYLIDFLKTVNAKNVVMEFHDDETALVFREHDSAPDCLYVIMPLSRDR